jgi:hypothetical protein
MSDNVQRQIKSGNGFKSEAAQAYINRCAKPNLEKSVGSFKNGVGHKENPMT